MNLRSRTISTLSSISRLLSPTNSPTNALLPAISISNDDVLPTSSNSNDDAIGTDGTPRVNEETMVCLSIEQLQELLELEISKRIANSTPTALSDTASTTSATDTATTLQAISNTLTKLSLSLSGTGTKRFDKIQDFPTFDGSDYMNWKTIMLCHLSTDPWKSVYDEMAGTWVKTTTDLELDNQLYKQVLRCLGGKVLSYIITCKNINGKGLALLEEIDSVYKTHATAPYLEKLMDQFRAMSRNHDESIDTYYTRLTSHVRNTNNVAISVEGVTTISDYATRRKFIMSLGKHFDNVIQQYRNGLLNWDEISWNELRERTRTILNDAELTDGNTSKGGGKKPTESGSGGGSTKKPTNNGDDYAAKKEEIQQWQKKVEELIKESPKDPSAELKKMQNVCGAECCVFHKTKGHSSKDCNTIRKLREKYLSTTANHAVAEEIFGPLSASNISGVDSGNTTNVVVPPYRSIIKGYCSYTSRKLSDCEPSSQDMIADSGANFHMFNDKHFFKDMKRTHTTSRVMLPDGASIPIEGIGTAYCRTEDGIEFELHDVLYVPKLTKSLFSLLIHLKTIGHSLEKINTTTMKLIFPTFYTFIKMKNEMFVTINPRLVQPKVNLPTANNSTFLKDDMPDILESTPNQLETIDPEPSIIADSDNTIYIDAQSTDQCGMDEGIQSGEKSMPSCTTHNMFAREMAALQSCQQQDVCPTHVLNKEEYMKAFKEILLHQEHIHRLDKVNFSSSSVMTIPSPMNVPTLRPVDKVSSTLPATVTINRDELHSCLGFRNIDNVVKCINTHYQPTIKLTSTPCDPVMDLGDVATMHKKARNTEPVERPKTFGEVFHCDIVFGPDIGIGNVHYALILVDRYSRFTYTYPLMNLNLDIIRSFKQFYGDIGIQAKRIIFDFDKKLIGVEARDFLSENFTQPNAAPPGRQCQNGLAERHWQTITAMARNWLASAQLPNIFWYMAIKRAAEVTNYLPVKIDENHLTPLELAYGIKPDLRTLFPMFCLAYVKKDRDGNRFRNKFDSMSEMMITVGKCSLSDGLLFYNPQTKAIVSSADYKLDPTITSGPKFGMEYRPGNWIYRLDDSTSSKSPIFKLDSLVLVHTHTPPHVAQVIDVPGFHRPDIYTVKHKDGSIVDYKSDVLESAPDTDEFNINVLPSWIKDGANCTLFLDTMDSPKHGKLHLKEDLWEFQPGVSSKNTPIQLDDFSSRANELLASAQLFRGHAKFPMVQSAREQRMKEQDLHTIIARHVSAVGLESLIPPHSLDKLQRNYSEHDQTIWMDAYREEYEGLTSIPTWQVLTEAEYRAIQHLYPKPLPSMAISTIKLDENGKPKRAKYRIVVLGNIDTYPWDNSQTSAPVMKHSELRLLVSIAIAHKRTMKNGDVKQAFVLSKLPPSETYIVRPPANCPLSAPNTYWRLLQSLYGLKRAPKIWFEKMSQILKDIGLRSCSSAPCIFYGRILPDAPPLYLGLYVDDFIYFSESDDFEKEFESRLASHLDGKVEFLGQVSQFLGMEFSWERNENELSVIMTQQTFIETLVESWNLQAASVKCINSPFRSGISIDTIPLVDLPNEEKSILRHKYQSLVGSLNWLTVTTRPDISTAVSLLAQFQSNPSPGHLDAALYCLKYLLNTTTLGIQFTTTRRNRLEAFLQCPLNEGKPISMSDSNWGPLDASNKPTADGPPKELELFKSRSISGFYVDLNGPLHWSSRRQGKTAVSSAVAKVYAANECKKYLLELEQVIDFLDCKDKFMPGANLVYVDNAACVQ